MATNVQQQQFALRRTVFGDQLHRHAASRGASEAVIVSAKKREKPMEPWVFFRLHDLNRCRRFLL